MKGLRKSNIVLLLAVVLSAVTLVFYIMNMHASYYKDFNGALTCTAALALLFGAGALAAGASKMPYGAIAADVCTVAAAALTVVSGGKFISMRVESFGYIFGSNLELGNKAAQIAGKQAIIAIILFVITWLVSLIAAFLKLGKKEV